MGPGDKVTQTNDIKGFPTLKEMKAGKTIQTLGEATGSTETGSKDIDMFDKSYIQY